MALMRERPDAPTASQKDQEKHRHPSRPTPSSLLALLPNTTTATPMTRTGEERKTVGLCHVEKDSGIMSCRERRDYVVYRKTVGLRCAEKDSGIMSCRERQWDYVV